MNTETKVTGVLATLLVLSTAPMPSYAATTEREGAFQPAVQQGIHSSGLLVAAGQRGGGGGGRAAGGGNRGGGGGGAAAANRGGGGGGAAAANRGGGQRQVRSQATSNVNHRAANSNVNSNRNINANNSGNRNVNNINNVNVSGDFDGGWNGGWDDNPLAAAAVIGGTAALVGSMVNSIPPSCTPVVVSGATYSQCGSTWYQPQYAGTSVQYEVVNPPQ